MNLNRNKALLTTAIIVCVSFGSSASAYSITDDFTTSQNPNGVWTYGWLDSLGGAFTTYDQLTTETFGSTISIWKDSSSPGGRGDAPAIAINSSGATYTGWAGTHVFQTGWAAFHPGINGYISDYRFTAPDAGIYNIAFDFEGADSWTYGPTSTQVFIRTNTDILYSEFITGSGYQSRRSFSGTVSLSEGQVLDIGVMDGGNGFYNDLTAIRGRIAAVPVPGTYAMMLAGLGVIGGVARRRSIG
ncbi:MAG: PEP-CTERM sorting domain-containing protein, partial [Candidatus Thiodiazotropha sp.]